MYPPVVKLKIMLKILATIIRMKTWMEITAKLIKIESLSPVL